MNNVYSGSSVQEEWNKRKNSSEPNGKPPAVKVSARVTTVKATQAPLKTAASPPPRNEGKGPSLPKDDTKEVVQPTNGVKEPFPGSQQPVHRVDAPIEEVQLTEKPETKESAVAQNSSGAFGELDLILQEIEKNAKSPRRFLGNRLPSRESQESSHVGDQAPSYD